LWLPVHLAIIAGATFFVTAHLQAGGALWILLPLSLLVGMSFAGLAFVGHETLHGSLTRNKALRHVVGFLGFLPFWVSPLLWIAWHNQVHHGNTNISGKDPDAYPDIEEYRRNTAARVAVQIGAPRSGKWRGVLTLLLGFTLQSQQILFSAQKTRYLSPKKHLIAVTQTLVALGFWAGLLSLIGGQAFLIVYVLPLMVGNSIVMAHITTNHSLSPLADENDALETSLTVTVPRWFEFYSLGFGYHVEHHLYPAMSNRHAPLVQEQLRKLAPDRYQEMPLLRALGLVWKTPRVYQDPTTLIDPETGQTARTLGAAPKSVRPVVHAPEVPVRPPVVVPQERTWDVLPGGLSSGPLARISSIPPPPAE
jgi:fatty acid desaturase